MPYKSSLPRQNSFSIEPIPAMYPSQQLTQSQQKHVLSKSERRRQGLIFWILQAMQGRIYSFEITLDGFPIA